MLNIDIEKEVFQQSIQKLTFSYCVSLAQLCKYSYTGEIATLYQQEEYIKSERRYGNIIQRLCKDSPLKKTAGCLIDKEKIYDDYLFESQVALYNFSSDKIGYKPIEEILPTSLIKDAAFLDESQPNIETIVKYYPYYPDDKRCRFNFIEFVLLINIYLTTRSRGLNTLNKNISSSSDKKLAQNLVDRLVNSMKAEKIKPFYVKAIFDVIEEVVNNMHIKKAEEHICIGWLPQKLKARKDKFRAFETHKINESKISVKDYEKTQFEKIIKSGNEYEKLKLFCSMDEYNAISYIGEILAMAFSILIDEALPDEFIQDNLFEYGIAKEYAEIVEKYIENTISEITKILKKIYL